jgi:hypothetical protein
MMETVKLPTAAKVFGILNCVFGGFALVVSPLSLLQVGSMTEIYQKIGLNSFTISWLSFTIVIAPVMALALLAFGIGLLLKKPWGRVGSVFYGLGVVALNILTILILGIGVLAAFGSIGSEDATTRAGLIGGAIGGLVGGVFGSIYPGLLAFFLSRPVVKDFYARYQ